MKSHWRTAGLIAAVIMAGSAGQVLGAANLIQNGDFEEPVMSSSLSFFADGEMPGWAVTYSSSDTPENEPLLEFWNHLNGWEPYSGSQNVELDGYDTVKISQTVATVPGWHYVLTYAWAPRPNVADNQMEVLVNGVPVASHAASGAGHSAISWTEATSTFNATGPETSVAFAEVGPNEPVGGLGMLLDGISLTADCEANANPAGPTEDQIIIPYSSPDYRYKIVPQGGESGFEALSYDDAANGFSSGSSGFGYDANQQCQLAPATEWPLNTDILLRKTFTLPAGTSALNVGIAVDNDVQVFINGQEISGSGLQTHENCATQDSFVFSVPLCLLHGGENLLAVRGRDRGVVSHLDVQVTAEVPADTDDDGILNISDNCPDVPNPDQADMDGDSIGDVCDDDMDGDGVLNDTDNCSLVFNIEQADFDRDGKGDACDDDADGDNVLNDKDICPDTPLNDVVNAKGCSINQLCPCAGPQGQSKPWSNHGQYVACVTLNAASLLRQRLITGAEMGAAVSAAARNKCGARSWQSYVPK